MRLHRARHLAWKGTSIGARIAAVVLFLAFFVTTLVSYRSIPVLAITLHDVYAVSFERGTFLVWHGQNRRADHTSIESINEPSLPWSAPMIGVPDHVGHIDADDVVGTIRRAISPARTGRRSMTSAAWERCGQSRSTHT